MSDVIIYLDEAERELEKAKELADYGTALMIEEVQHELTELRRRVERIDSRSGGSDGE